MNKGHPITGFWSFLLAVVLRPTWEFLTTSVVFLFLATTTWIRDNFASEEWKRRLELKGFLPHWDPAWWICIGLLVLLFLIVRESYRLWAEEADANAELRKDEKPRPLLKIAGYYNVARDWRVMRNSGQVDTRSKTGDAYGFQVGIENSPPAGQLGVIAEKVAAQITFYEDRNNCLSETDGGRKRSVMAWNSPSNTTNGKILVSAPQSFLRSPSSFTGHPKPMH